MVLLPKPADSSQAALMMMPLTFWARTSSTSEVSFWASPLASVVMSLMLLKWAASCLTASDIPMK